ncbi:hypothetical protein N789_09365 [Arenimonas oryziterrae DSM 21050 = YC6267]|uniref:Uncharacterized protein n=1 Tax=Arenimonas oryziterrae DSM 21050 = YC6267 TaxID=1121015 RepID=A0A091ATH5_9GAMM|nr:hypothetical protein N789_09365 [Arenimonas oryziterrae DSM 21050 = YC6267]
MAQAGWTFGFAAALACTERASVTGAAAAGQGIRTGARRHARVGEEVEVASFLDHGERQGLAHRLKQLLAGARGHDQLADHSLR